MHTIGSWLRLPALAKHSQVPWRLTNNFSERTEEFTQSDDARQIQIPSWDISSSLHTICKELQGQKTFQEVSVESTLLTPGSWWFKFFNFSGFFFFFGGGNYALLADTVIYTPSFLQNVMWNDTTWLYSPLQTYDTPDRLYTTWHECHATGSHPTCVILSPTTNNMAATNSMEAKLASLNIQPQNLLWQ
jgi:hypothetical protein